MDEPRGIEPPFFRVNGTDILPYIKESGMKWQRNDVDDPKTGRTMDATMHRSRVATKFRVDFEAIPLNSEQTRFLMNLIMPVFVDVETNLHPLYGYFRGYFYSNNVPATCMMIDKKTGGVIWTGITFPLIEK